MIQQPLYTLPLAISLVKESPPLAFFVKGPGLAIVLFPRPCPRRRDVIAALPTLPLVPHSRPVRHHEVETHPLSKSAQATPLARAQFLPPIAAPLSQPWRSRILKREGVDRKIRFVLRFARPACRGVSGLRAEGVRESGFISKRKEKGDLVPIQFSLRLIPFVYLTSAISIDWPRV